MLSEIDKLQAEVERLRAKNEKLRAVLEMVRDADDDCRMDGLATIPAAARQSIDDALEAKP
jgi:prefoldin subunit 5